jgi:hypothetical protein
MPPTVASTATRTGRVTAIAIPIWLSAAMTPSAMMKIEAMLARMRP